MLEDNGNDGCKIGEYNLFVFYSFIHSFITKIHSKQHVCYIFSMVEWYLIKSYLFYS